MLYIPGSQFDWKAPYMNEKSTAKVAKLCLVSISVATHIDYPPVHARYYALRKYLLGKLLHKLVAMKQNWFLWPYNSCVLPVPSGHKQAAITTVICFLFETRTFALRSTHRTTCSATRLQLHDNTTTSMASPSATNKIPVLQITWHAFRKERALYNIKC